VFRACLISISDMKYELLVRLVNIGEFDYIILINRYIFGSTSDEVTYIRGFRGEERGGERVKD